MSVTVPVTQRRSSLPGGTPCVELPRFLVNSFHSSLDISLPSQVPYQMGQIHFRVSCLKPAFHRSLREFLELICPRALKEEIRIASDVLNGRQRDCVDPLLYHRITHCGKTGNPKRERPDELV